MAVTTSKVTYSLKPQTVDRVQELATAWGIPKSEVIRRAVESLEAKSVPRKETPLEIFERIQREGTGISASAAEKFMREVRRERRASGLKRG
jgi:Arc/MetJ-type ribon-helix-helix transcriptional regulator